MLARLPEAARNGGAREVTEALVAFGRGERSIFDARREELRQGAAAQEALEASGMLAVRLGDEVAALVAGRAERVRRRRAPFRGGDKGRRSFCC